MVSVAKELVVIVIGGLIARGIFHGVKNKLDGKDFFGNKVAPKQKTYMNWLGDIYLGSEDYQVV